MTEKNGGDVGQLNNGIQGNAASSDLTGLGNIGPALLDSAGGHALTKQQAAQHIHQGLAQDNIGFGGHGGNDNIWAPTTITIM